MQFERELALRKEREDALHSELRIAAEQARRSVAAAAQRLSSAPSSAPEISGRVGSPRGLGSVVTQLLGVGKPDFQVETPEPSLRVSAPTTTLTTQTGVVSTLWKTLRGSRSSGPGESPQPLATGATSVEYLSRPPQVLQSRLSTGGQQLSGGNFDNGGGSSQPPARKDARGSYPTRKPPRPPSNPGSGGDSDGDSG